MGIYEIFMIQIYNRHYGALQSPGLGQARPKLGLELGLGPGLRFVEAQALRSQAQALKARPSQAWTSLSLFLLQSITTGFIVQHLQCHSTA